MLSELFLMRKRLVTFAEGVTLIEKICYKCWAICFSWGRDLLLLLKELFLQNRSVTNAEWVVSHEKEICYFCRKFIVTEQTCCRCWASCSSWERDLLLLWKSYCYRTDLLKMVSKLFLMRKRLVTFVEEVLLQNRPLTNAEQFISHEEELLLQNRFVTNAEQFISHEEELLLQNRSLTNAEQFISHEEELLLQNRFLQMLSNLFLMRKSYCYRTDLLEMLSKLFLMRKRFVTFAEELLLQNRPVTNAEQIVSHE